MVKEDNIPSRPTHLSTEQERRARIWESEVYPLTGERMADLLMRGDGDLQGGHILQVGCGLGQTTTQLLQRLDGDSRIVVVEENQALLDRARANINVEWANERVFFRAHPMGETLPFADDGFDMVLAHVALSEVPDHGVLLAEFMRVLKAGGTLRLATPVEGTWREFLDIYQDVLIRLRNQDMLDALTIYLHTFPNPELVACQLETLGLERVVTETSRWELVFRSAREFFYAPVIELGPLAHWKAIAGKGKVMQDVMFALKEAIEVYFGSRPFSVSLYSGLFVGKKASPENSP